MDSPSLAAVDLARTFYVQGQHVLALIGRKTAGSEIELLECPTSDGTFVLRLHRSAPGAQLAETFYVVRPLFDPGPMRRSLRLLYGAGGVSMPVEPLNCGSLRVTGVSPSFRLDEAFEDALRQLPLFRRNPPDQPLPLVDILAMGAIYGGFTGFSRLFLRVGVSA